jgi:N-acetylneuraminic acid mutarotase
MLTIHPSSSSPRRSIAGAGTVLLLAFLAGAPPAEASPLDLDERVNCHGVVEEVYHRHRIWPAANPEPKPPLSAVLPPGELERRAEDSLAMSAALEELWGETLGGRALQTELDRMARDSRRPERLAELYAALHDDPLLVAECLVRPRLAARRLRARYAADEELHAETRRRAQEELATASTAPELSRLPGYQEERWVRDPVATGLDALSFSTEEWRRATDELSTLFASGGLQAGAVSDLQETEEGLWAVGILAATAGELHLARVAWEKRPFAQWWSERRERFVGGSTAEQPRLVRLPELGPACEPDSWEPMPALPHASRDVESVWTGSEMIVFGGASTFSRGGRYDPAIDTWYPISIEGEPGRRRDHTAVWTGTEMIVWGGWGFETTSNVLGDGARYDPVHDRWTPISQAGAPSPRTLHTAVWTGDEMIVWAGCPHFQCFSTLGDGARYHPPTDSWSPVSASGAPEARGEHVAVWTGQEMIVWGGGEYFAGVLDTGGIYDPMADEWRATPVDGAPQARNKHTAVWSGTEMVVWGGQGDAGFLASGGRYDPSADSWEATSLVDAPEARRRHSSVWSGDEMIVWGGCVDSECTQHRGNGGRYDPVVDAWSAVSEVGDPGGRSQHTAVWTGSEMILWGGCSGGECQISRQDGGRYDPSTDGWMPTADPGMPTARLNHTGVWTGAEMIVWGGNGPLGLTLTGGRYDPATDSWSPTAIDGVAGARDLHTAIWTGSEMVVWGGRLAGIGTTALGARYDPLLDSWAGIESSGAPEARAAHTAVWDGARMVVWGGCRFSDCQSVLDTGGLYDPAGDGWSPMASTGAPAARFLHTAVSMGDEMIVWGGSDLGGAFATGGRYDVVADSWAPTSTLDAPAARDGHTAVSTGSEMIVWGGANDVEALATGGRYDPVADAWVPVETAGAPPARTGHVAVWADRMLVWGGCDAPACTAFQGDTFHVTGGVYDPIADQWVATTEEAAPPGRTLASALWDGERLLVWGGWRGGGETTHSGGLYCPTDSRLLFQDGFETGGLSAWSQTVQ